MCPWLTRETLETFNLAYPENIRKLKCIQYLYKKKYINKIKDILKETTPLPMDIIQYMICRDYLLGSEK
jgi:hypothetical protein